jgi:hypothetical protein
MAFKKNQSVLYIDRGKLRVVKILQYIEESNSYAIQFTDDGGRVRERETIPDRLAGYDQSVLEIKEHRKKIDVLYDQVKFLTRHVEKLVKNSANRR